MGHSCLKAHVSISGALATLCRGTVGREELRDFWQCALSHSTLGWLPWYLLCASSCSFIAPPAVLLLILGRGCAGSIFAGSDIVSEHNHCRGVGWFLPLTTSQAKVQRQCLVEKKGLFYLRII